VCNHRFILSTEGLLVGRGKRAALVVYTPTALPPRFADFTIMWTQAGAILVKLYGGGALEEVCEDLEGVESELAFRGSEGEVRHHRRALHPRNLPEARGAVLLLREVFRDGAPRPRATVRDKAVVRPRAGAPKLRSLPHCCENHQFYRGLRRSGSAHT